HALLAIGEHEAAGAMEAAGLAGDLLELVIEGDRVAWQLLHVGIAVERVEAARRVPGRARCQLVALDQHDILPSSLGEMIEDAATDDAAADHYHLRMRFHCSLSQK